MNFCRILFLLLSWDIMKMEKTSLSLILAVLIDYKDIEDKIYVIHPYTTSTANRVHCE